MTRKQDEPIRRSLAGPTAKRSAGPGGGTYAEPDPESGWVTVGNVPGWPAHTFRVRTERVGGKPRMIGLSIEPRDDADPRDAVLTRELMPDLPLGLLTAWGSLGGPVPDVFAVLAWVKRERLGAPPERPRGGSDEYSEWIADVYLRAKASGHSGQRAIAKALGLPDTRPEPDDTATMRADRKAAQTKVERRITEARRRGKLPPAEPRERH